MDPVLRWTPSISPNVNTQTVQWTRNGQLAGAATVPAGIAQTDWTTANPSITLAPGDVISATVIENDTVDNLQSTPAVSNSLVIPTPVSPPAPATNLVLSLT